MIGVVEEPSGKAVLSTVLDHDIFESAVDDDDSRKSWKNEKIVKKVITSTPEKLHVDNSEEDNHSARNGDIVQSSSQKNETISQDSDNEIDSSTYKERNRLLIFDSDDDDGNGDDALVEIKSNGQHEVDKDSSDGDDSDDDVVLSTFKKKNRSFLDSDCDDENDDKSETPMRKKIKKTILESDDESDDEEKKDDDSEDEEENRASDNNDADEEMNNGEEMIRAKSTKERSDRELKPRRAKKSDVQSIHSESQRIVRESVVSLPYHKPKPLSLDDFFNKKPIIKELKPIKGKIPTRKLKISNDGDSKEINLTMNDDGKEIEKHNTSPKLDKNNLESPATDNKQINDDKENEKKSRFTPARTKLKLQKEVVCLTPTLRGGPNDFIDLDGNSGNGSLKNKGLQTLKSRFLKHTEKPKVRTPKQVQLSVIQKKTAEDGKQELKCNKFTVLLDGEEEIDSKMQVPGAKLSKLKETLQAKMKMKRDQERKKREEAYQLDNEEGFEDDFMDDDGELTDKTDTDIEEEDDDDMGIEGIEKEADDDDGDDVIDVVNGGAAKNKTQKNVDGGSEFLSLKLLDTSIRSDPSASSGSSSFKTPAKVITGPNHSTDTMNLYDSTCSLPSDVSDLQPCDNDKNNSWKDFNFGLIEQKKGLIKHKSKDFGEYDFSDGENEMLKLAVESDKEEKDMPDIKNVSYNGLDASFDPASMIPAYQPGGGSTNQDHNKSATSGRNSPDFFTPFTKRQISTGSLQKSTGKLSDLSLPVEDSQDLFNSPARSHHSRNSDSLSQNFHFSLDDETQSQFLDENGFLNVRSTTKPKVSKRQLLLSDASNENLDELLGLCSGKFTEDTQSSSSSIKECVNPKPKGLFSHFSSGELASSCQRSSMDELLGLCSGTFTESSKEKTENTKENEEKEEDDDDGSDVSFHIMSDVEDEEDEDETLTKRKEKRRRVMQFSDEDDEDDDNMDGEEDHSVEEELSETEDEGAKPKVKAKPVPMPDFIEDEAELSGSEAGSDDEEGDYGDDEYEEDAIDEELPEADMLKDQINRIHMKTVEDDDARKLRLYKEMYLQDGDLWSDGKGRTRRFRWNNVEDESSQMDMFWKASDNEESDQETEEDLKWRKERYEREQWLEEQKQEKDGVFDIDEDSQFTKIIKNIQIKKKASPKKLPAPPPPKEKVKDKEVTVPKPLHQTMFRRGSFLCRSKKDLEKIAAMAKPVANPSGPKNSRNFVFQALSPPKDGVTKKPQVRRSISVTGAVEQSISKRPRLERSQSTVVAKTSIFEHFD